MDNISILLVDDEEFIQHSIGMALRQENYSVTLASSGEEAFNVLKSIHVDLIVTDLVLPGIDGIQVLREAKKINSMIGVIILTGYGDMTSAIDALRIGADDYLLKPCSRDELLIRIERCLEKQTNFKKVKLYEKILPICMYCKNIRDDTGTEPGKGKWMRIEGYLHQESGIVTSHGICPDCYEKQVKEMTRKDRKQSK